MIFPSKNKNENENNCKMDEYQFHKSNEFVLPPCTILVASMAAGKSELNSGCFGGRVNGLYAVIELIGVGNWK